MPSALTYRCVQANHTAYRYYVLAHNAAGPELAPGAPDGAGGGCGHVCMLQL